MTSFSNKNTTPLFRWLLAIGVVTGLYSSGRAEEIGVGFFEEKILPVLKTHCYECHSEEEGKSKGGLRVDSKHALVQGGDTGAAIVAGNVDESLLLTSVRYEDPDYEMPPDGKLPDPVIADFEKWILAGAPDPREAKAPVEVEETTIDWETARDFWSFRHPKAKPAASASDSEWARSEMDRYILAAREKMGLRTVRDARPETLVRRLYFTLTGLPPSAEEVLRWVPAIGPSLNQEAIERLVDHLLASGAFGERWAQHWMDVARYGDSTGGDSNNIYPEAWRYREYVVRSFQEDKPFDQFIREQLAGDLLPAHRESERAMNLVATGFLAVGQKLVGEVDERKFRADLIDEQIDATTRAFLGLSVACARCHDHKSDPVPQSDYYAMASFFQNTETYYGLLDAQARQSSTLLDVTSSGIPSGRPVLNDEEFEQLKAEYEEALADMEEVRAGIRDKEVDVSRAKLRRSRTKLDRTEAAMLAYDGAGHPRTLIMGVEDRDEFVETRLLVRGEFDQPGPVVQPGFLRVMEERPLSKLNGSGRLELANWIASSENPLTARVAVNRIWHWLFGQGLVRSVDDFGASGERPLHPDLLDFLAQEFVKKEWSVKSMIRDIVLSRTWQQAAQHDSDNFEIDPDNRYFWRAPQRRLEGEAIRDAMLRVSGNLQVGPPERPLLDRVGEGTVGQNVYEPEIRKIDTRHRSIYLPRVRNVLPEVLSLFDLPDSSGVTGSREVTTVPLQALFALNHEFVSQQAAAFAQRVAAESYGEQINFAYLTAYGRYPTPREKEFARTFQRLFSDEENGAEDATLTAYCQVLLCAAEFGIID